MWIPWAYYDQLQIRSTQNKGDTEGEGVTIYLQNRLETKATNILGHGMVRAGAVTEKVGLYLPTNEKHPSGAKAQLVSLALAAWLKPCPFKTRLCLSFS